MIKNMAPKMPKKIVTAKCARHGCDNQVQTKPAALTYPYCSEACAKATRAKETLAITYSIACEPEDVDFRGQFNSGDEAADRKLEDEINDRLDQGDQWAWCYVKVTAKAAINGVDTGFTGTAGLGACSYKDEAEFRTPGGYFDDLCKEAKDDLGATLTAAIQRGREADKVQRMLLDQLLATLSPG